MPKWLANSGDCARVFEGVSALSLAASGYYVLIAVLGAAAAFTASNEWQPKWHLWTWAALALFFVGLTLFRWIAAEDVLRDGLREILRAQGEYDGRREFQSVLVSAVLVGFSALGFWWLYRATRQIKGRRNIALLVALGSAGAMGFLIALRLVSLHAVDWLLFGPLKLNWVIDIGSSTAVLLAAIVYVRLVRARP